MRLMSPQQSVLFVLVGLLYLSTAAAQTGSTLDIGGYAKLSTLISDIAQPGESMSDQLFVVSGIPLRDGRNYVTHDTHSHAKESRLWLRASSPTALGDAGLLIEYDWVGSASSYSPRLRHFYVRLGSALAGQTYSAFTNAAALADTHAAIAVGNIVVRQSLLRWTQNAADDSSQWIISLEEPLSRIARPGMSGMKVRNDERTPDTVVRWQSWQDWGNMTVSAMARRIAYQATGTRDQKKWGGAVSVTGVINVGTLDNVRLMFGYGNALGRYIGSTVADAYADANDSLSLRTSYGGTLAYQHYWTDTLRSTLALGFSRADLPMTAGSGMTREARSAHANVMWSPVSHTTFILEYLYGFRSTKVGIEGELNRLQLSARINF